MKNILYASFLFLLVFAAGCKKEDNSPTYSTLTYTNSVFTDIKFVANGTTTIIHPGATATFTGTPGTAYDFTASSSGQTSDGIQLGVGLEWSGPNTFPTRGTTYGSEFKLDPSDFFLYLTNNSDSLTVVDLTTNYGSTDELTDVITIGPDRTQYSIGYYKRYSNTIIRANYTTTHTTGGYTELANPTYSQDGNGNYYLDFVVHN